MGRKRDTRTSIHYPMPSIKIKTHRPSWQGPKVKPYANAKRRDDVYQSTRWKALRKWWQVNNPLCVNRGKAMYYVDHIVPLSKWKGDPFDQSNLQSLCRACGDIKTANERKAI